MKRRDNISKQRWLFGGISPSHENKSPSPKNPHPQKLPGIKIPNPRDVYLGDICEIPGIYIPIPGDFLGIFIPGIFWGFFRDGDLFPWDGDIPPKSHLWLRVFLSLPTVKFQLYTRNDAITHILKTDFVFKQ